MNRVLDLCKRELVTFTLDIGMPRHFILTGNYLTLDDIQIQVRYTPVYSPAAANCVSRSAASRCCLSTRLKSTGMIFWNFRLAERQLSSITAATVLPVHALWFSISSLIALR